MPDVTDYNPVTQELSATRNVTVDTGWEESRLKQFLVEHEGACIYNTLSHKPISEDKVMLDGEPYVDIFGLNVYILSNVSWYPHKDIDERFNEDEYPNDMESELNDYFTG